MSQSDANAVPHGACSTVADAPTALPSPSAPPATCAAAPQQSPSSSSAPSQQSTTTTSSSFSQSSISYLFPECAGRFTVLRKLGSGAFSSVWLAEDVQRPPPHPHHLVALKRIKPLSSAQRVHDEARFLEQLAAEQHSVELLEVLLSPSSPHAHPTLVLSFFPHAPFKDYLAALSLRHLQWYMTALLSAFRHLHGQQPRPIIHRDLKPANWLFAFPPTAEMTLQMLRQQMAGGQQTAGGDEVQTARAASAFCLVDFGLSHQQDEKAPELRAAREEMRKRQMEQSSQQQQQQQQQHDAGGSLTTASAVSPKRRKTLHSALPAFPSSVSLPAVSAPALSAPSIAPPPLPRASVLGTRGFRAPEILLRHPKRLLSTGCDVWNIGVIFLSLLSQRYPVFDRSDSEEAVVQLLNMLAPHQQQTRIGDTLLTWSQQRESRTGEDADAAPLLLPSSSSSSPSSAAAVPPAAELQYPTVEEWCWLSSERHWPAAAFDLLRRLLALDQTERISCEEALQHPFLLTDWDEKEGDGYRQRRQQAEENERLWKQRQQQREERWRRRAASKRPVSYEKENLHHVHRLQSSALSGLNRLQLQDSACSAFTSRAELGEEALAAAARSGYARLSLTDLSARPQPVQQRQPWTS